MNLSGLDKDTLARGIELATPGYLHGSHVIDVELHCLDVTDKPLKTTATVRLETGTCEVAARIILLDRRRLDPGESCYAQLRAGDPVPSTFGQRFILRSENATRTIGGGVVLRPRGERKRRNADTERDSLDRLRTGNPPDRVEDVLRNAAFTTPPDLTICALAGVELAEVPGLLDQLRREGRWMAIPGTHVMIVPSALTELSQRLCRWLERFHRREPDSPGRHVDAVLGWLDRVTATAVSRPLLDHFVNQGAVKFFGRYVCLAPFAPKLTAADEKLLASLLDTMDSAGFQPPLPELWAKEHRVERKRIGRLLQLAVAMGELASIDGKIYLHTNKEHELRRVVASLIDRHGRVTVAQVRESIESSRKYTVPYMEYLDRIGFTRRDGDERVLNHAEQAEHRAR